MLLNVFSIALLSFSKAFGADRYCTKWIQARMHLIESWKIQFVIMQWYVYRHRHHHHHHHHHHHDGDGGGGDDDDHDDDDDDDQ